VIATRTGGANWLAHQSTFMERPHFSHTDGARLTSSTGAQDQV